MRLELAVAVTFFPDHSLQRFQCSLFSVLIDPLLQKRDHFVLRGRHQIRFFRSLVQPVLNVGIVRVCNYKRRQMFTCIRKKRFLDEADRAGRSFDVGQDCLDHRAVPALLCSILAEYAVSMARFTLTGSATRTNSRLLSPRPVTRTLPYPSRRPHVVCSRSTVSSALNRISSVSRPTMPVLYTTRCDVTAISMPRNRSHS